MPKTSYERLDRSTGWFDADGCTHRFEGVNKARPGDLWLEVIYRTREGVWINSQWSFEGPWKHTGHRFSFWQVTLDQAAEWFPQNYQDAPDILIEDFGTGVKPGGLIAPSDSRQAVYRPSVTQESI